MEVGSETARRLWERSGIGPSEVDLPQVYDGFSPFVYLWMEALSLCPVGEAHRLALDGGIDSDQAGALPVLSGGGALGNGRMHGVPQMLECYLQLSGRAGERQRAGLRSVWRAIRLRTTAAPWPTVRSSSDVRSDGVSASTREHGTNPATVAHVTWAERAADRSPVVQRSRDRGVEQATSIVAAARRLMESKGPSFTTQELIKEAGIALQTFYRYFPGKDYLLLAVIEDVIDENCAVFRKQAAKLPDPIERLRYYVTATVQALERARRQSELHDLRAFPAADAVPRGGVPGHPALHRPSRGGNP